MNRSFHSKRIAWCAACALALGLALGNTQASDVRPGAHIWKNVDGVWCWNREFIAGSPPANCGEPQGIAQSAALPALAAAPAAPAPLPYAAPVTSPSPAPAQDAAPAAAPVASVRAPRRDRH